jgi:hypothetical protein
MSSDPKRYIGISKRYSLHNMKRVKLERLHFVFYLFVAVPVSLSIIFSLPKLSSLPSFSLSRAYGTVPVKGVEVFCFICYIWNDIWTGDWHTPRHYPHTQKNLIGIRPHDPCVRVVSDQAVPQRVMTPLQRIENRPRNINLSIINDILISTRYFREMTSVPHWMTHSISAGGG